MSSSVAVNKELQFDIIKIGRYVNLGTNEAVEISLLRFIRQHINSVAPLLPPPPGRLLVCAAGCKENIIV